MTDEGDSPRPLQRVPTRIAGLDAVLHGGLFRSGIYMVMGRPGTGKTTLGNQIAFNHVAAGGRAICLTLLTDSHDRMLAGMQSMSFYDPNALFAKISYLSAYQVLEAEKLPGLLKLLRNSIREYSATMLIIDGVVTAEAMAPTEIDLKKFLHELQVLSELFGCTALLLTGARSDADAHYAERTMVDGLLNLTLEAHGSRATRYVEVLKHRASDGLLGRHVFTIGSAGVTIFPRLECRAGHSPPPARKPSWISSGSASLDAVLAGGIAANSITGVVGAAGTGKTTLALQFLAAGAAKGEQAHLLTFGEAPDSLRNRAVTETLGYERLLKSGKLTTQWRPGLETLADCVADELLARVRAESVERLVIDGIDALTCSLESGNRARWFLSALCNELRTLGITAMLTSETADLSGIFPDEPVQGYWGFVDSLLHLRYGERDGKLVRTLIVPKQRAGQQDAAIHAYSLSDNGLEVRGNSLRAGTRRSARKPVGKRRVTPSRAQIRRGKG